MHLRVLIKSQRTEIIYYIFRETASSKNFTNIKFCKLTYIFVNQAVEKLMLAKVNDVKVKGLVLLNNYKQDISQSNHV